MQDSNEEEVESFAALHHGLQAYTYYMGYRYHKRRNRKVYKVICQVGMAFHLWSVYKHLRDLK
jgi:hypothetical protein